MALLTLSIVQVLSSILSSSFFLQEKLVATMSREELDLASCPEDAVSDMTKNRVSLFVGLTHSMGDSFTILCKFCE